MESEVYLYYLSIHNRNVNRLFFDGRINFGLGNIDKIFIFRLPVRALRLSRLLCR